MTAYQNYPDKVQTESLFLASEIKDRAVKLKGVPTGVEGLDELFFVSKIENGKAKIIPLGGYPAGAVVNLTGIPDTGKSLMAEQFVIKQASLGRPAIFVTVEQPAEFLVSGLKQRAEAMGVPFENIDDLIVIIDAASNATLREDITSLADTLAYAIKKYRSESVVIDSVTGLYEAREMMARQTVRYLYNFMKKWHQTSLFVSQKRSGHEELTSEAAGGYAVGHIVDCSIVLSKKEILTRYEQSMYGKPIGELIRLLRIDGCRLCGHDTRVRVLEINELGLVSVKETLVEYLQKIKS